MITQGVPVYTYIYCVARVIAAGDWPPCALTINLTVDPILLWMLGAGNHIHCVCASCCAVVCYVLMCWCATAVQLYYAMMQSSEYANSPNCSVDKWNWQFRMNAVTGMRCRRSYFTVYFSWYILDKRVCIKTFSNHCISCPFSQSPVIAVPNTPTENLSPVEITITFR